MTNTLEMPTMTTPQYQPDNLGYYGEFGGAFIPEMLHHNVETLRKNYLKITKTKSFQTEFKSLLRDFVGRPTPLYFAENMSKEFGAQIYLKREDLCHTGAHKINNTIGQILLAQRLGKTRIIAETGAGQHGVATATVCALKGLPCIVYMGAVDIERQAPNVARMRMLGAEVRPAMSGSRTLKDATNEAIRDWINNPEDTHYIIGSVVGPHPYPDMVAKFQSVISEEIMHQLKAKTGKKDPDYVVACVGGGSNAAGAFYHFLDNPSVKLIAVEAAGEGKWKVTGSVSQSEVPEGWLDALPLYALSGDMTRAEHVLRDSGVPYTIIRVGALIPSNPNHPAAAMASGKSILTTDVSRFGGVFRADLDRSPRDGRALAGLRDTLKAEGRDYEALQLDQQYRAAWKTAATRTSSSSR